MTDLAAALEALLALPGELARQGAELRALREEVAALRRSLPPVLLPYPEAARLLGVSVATVRRRARSGDLPVVRVGRIVRIDLSALRPANAGEVARLAHEARRSV